MPHIRIAIPALALSGMLALASPAADPPRPAEPPAPGATWRLVPGYPKPTQDFVNISANPANRASPGMITYQHVQGVTTTFSFKPPPPVLVVGQTYEVGMAGVGVTPSDHPLGAATGMIWVDAPTRSIHDGRLGGSKRTNSSYYIQPTHARQSNLPNWATEDRLSFEFRPTGSKPFSVSFGPLGPAAFQYLYEPAAGAPAGGDLRVDCNKEGYGVPPYLLREAFDKGFVKDQMDAAGKAALQSLEAAGVTPSKLLDHRITLGKASNLLKYAKFMEAAAAQDSKKGIEAALQAVAEVGFDLFLNDLGLKNVAGPLMATVKIIRESEKELRHQQCLLDIDLAYYSFLDDPRLNTDDVRRNDWYLEQYIIGNRNDPQGRPRARNREYLQCYIDSVLPPAQRFQVVRTRTAFDMFGHLEEAMQVQAHRPQFQTVANIMLGEFRARRKSEEALRSFRVHTEQSGLEALATGLVYLFGNWPEFQNLICAGVKEAVRVLGPHGRPGPNRPVRIEDDLARDSFFRFGDGAWLPLTPDDDLRGGSDLRTGPGGVINLLIGDGDRLQVQPSTDVRIRNLQLNPGAPPVTDLYLQQGRLNLRIAPATTGRDVRVETPAATVTVQGTEFSVGHDSAAGTTVAVAAGRVEVRAKSGGTRLVDAGGQLRVDAAGRLPAPADGNPPRYLGCFREEGQADAGRDLNGARLVDARMSNALCIAACRDRGFAYAGTAYPNVCFCGNRYGSLGPAGNCDVPCPGSPGEMCGGGYAASVWAVGGGGGQGDTRPADPGHRQGGHFPRPTVDGIRVDWCATWSTDCGQAGADQFCRAQGYRRAAQWGWEHAERTWVMGSRQHCNSSACGALRDVICVDRPPDYVALPPPPAGPEYLGCFRDDSARDLDGASRQDPRRMGAQDCIGECRAKGFAYAGTQVASHCFCGQRYGRYGPAGNCDMACIGNPQEKCGGSWANSVYRVR
jgi:hypothetical protein